MILKTVLLFKNNLIYYVIFITLLSLSINNYFYITVLAPYCYFIFKYRTIHVRYIGIISSVFILSYAFQFTSYIEEKETYKITVVNDINTNMYTSFTGKTDGILIKVYLKNYIELIPGDIINVSGELKTIENPTTPDGFNYKNYLKSKKIYQSIYVDSYELIYNKLVISIIPYKIEKYITKNTPNSSEYVKTFILADKGDFDDEVISEINNLGISHLFAVSGMHIGLIVLFLKKLIDMMKINTRKSDIIISLFLVFYMVITSFTPSVVRASLMFILLVVNKRVKLGFSTLDILSIIFVLLLVYNPYYMYSLGFVLSFSVTFVIILSKNILKDRAKNEQLFFISLMAFLSTIPLIMNVNHEVNLLSILYNLLYIYIVTFVILPLSYLTFAFPIVDHLYSIIITIFETTIGVFSGIDIFKIRMSFNSPFIVVIYYFIVYKIFVSFEDKKVVYKLYLSLIFLTILTMNLAVLNPYQSVTFIDVYGDAIFVKDAFDKCNILIDTGDVDDYNTVINYLHNNSIKRIDYLIISHMHSDHYGETNDLIENFKITEIISNNNHDDGIDHNITCGNIQIHIYETFEYSENENNNSLIFSLFIAGEHYLFTGDIEEDVEKSFTLKYDFNIDVLKVAHHGSRTSSTPEFINKFSPSEAVISAHRNNKFGHPHLSTVNLLEDNGIIVYRTDMSGTVKFQYLFGKRTIYTYPP